MMPRTTAAMIAASMFLLAAFAAGERDLFCSGSLANVVHACARTMRRDS